jgi:hypothetical protein
LENVATGVAAEVHPHHPSFTPKASAVMSAAVVAQVFEDQPVPFALNADGSVDRAVYLAWLNDAGLRALAAFDECSEPVKPRRRTTAA